MEKTVKSYSQVDLRCNQEERTVRIEFQGDFIPDIETIPQAARLTEVYGGGDDNAYLLFKIDQNAYFNIVLDEFIEALDNTQEEPADYY